MEIIHFTRELLFPGGCGICGEALIDGREAFSGLCSGCAEKLAYSPENRCRICSKPLISEIDICLHCRENQGSEDRFTDSVFALYPYTGIFRQLLASYKFRSVRQLAHFLAEKLLDAGTLLESTYGHGFGWVPVPPRPGKIKKTGWDQVDYLAGKIRRASATGGNAIHVEKCLKRLSSKTQKMLNRDERLSNLKGHIVCAKKPSRNIILFDDVITTGATMQACAAALKKAGAEHVHGLCLFYD